MPPEESSYPADWLRIAEKDLRRAAHLLEIRGPELAGFCLQQSVEKYLKAFLLFHGWQLRRIHDLDALLDDAVDQDPTLEEFRSLCQKITVFYTVERALGRFRHRGRPVMCEQHGAARVPLRVLGSGTLFTLYGTVA